MVFRRIRRCVAAGAVALGLVATPAAWAETLTDAFVSAYLASNLLEQRRALLRVADEDVVQASAGLLPVIGFVARGDFTAPARAGSIRIDNWTATANLTAQLTLWDNGVTRFATDAAKETVLGLRAALLDVEQQVLLGTVQAYMGMILASQNVSLGQSNVRLITRELRAARDRFEVGEVTRTDVAIAEARLAAARGTLAAVQGDLEIAREAYKAVVGRYPGNLRWPSTPASVARTEDTAKSVAVRRHPSIDEAQRNVNAAESNILRAKAAMRPSVFSDANVRFTEGFESTFSAGVGVNVPIYQGGTLRSLTRQSVARRDAARAALLQSVIDVKQAVGVSWANRAVAAARTEASRRQVTAAQIAYDGVREEAKFGARTTLDVLDAEQELLEARVTLISSQVDQYVSLYSLMSAMGLLTAEQLGLGIVTYDPIDYYNYATTRSLSPQGRSLDRVLRFLGGN